MIYEEKSSCWVTDPLGSYLVKPMIFSALMALFYAQCRILIQQCSKLIGRSIFIFQIISDIILFTFKTRKTHLRNTFAFICKVYFSGHAHEVSTKNYNIYLIINGTEKKHHKLFSTSIYKVSIRQNKMRERPYWNYCYFSVYTKIFDRGLWLMSATKNN